MDELTPKAQQILAHVRAAHRPSDRRRIHADIRATIEQGAGPRAAPDRDRGRGYMALIILAAAVVLIAFAIPPLQHYLASTAPDPSDSKNEAPYTAHPVPVPVPVPAPVPAPSPADANVQVPEAPEVPEVPEVPNVPVPAPNVPVPAPDAPNPELTALKQIKKAFESNAHSRVRTLAAQYRTDHPNGIFTPEVSALETMSRCATATPQAARAEATRFAQRHPGSVFVARVRERCGP